MDYVCVLAAGSGTRLYPMTRHVPKHLVEIHGNTILGHIVSYWEQYCKNFLIIVQPEHVGITNVFMKRYSNSYQLIECSGKNGTADALEDSLKNFKMKNILVTWCDLYPKVPINVPVVSTIFTNKNNNARYLADNGQLINCGSNGNVIGIYYFNNYQGWLDFHCPRPYHPKYETILDYYK